MSLSFWEKDGSIIVDKEGQPILCQQCPCGQKYQIIGGISRQVIIRPVSIIEYYGYEDTVVCTAPYKLISGNCIQIDFLSTHIVQLTEQQQDNTVYTHIYTNGANSYQLRLYQLSKVYTDYDQFRDRFFCTSGTQYDVWRWPGGPLTNEANIQMQNQWNPEMQGRKTNWQIQNYDCMAMYSVYNDWWEWDQETWEPVAQYGLKIRQDWTNIDIPGTQAIPVTGETIQQLVASYNASFNAVWGPITTKVNELNNKLNSCASIFIGQVPEDWPQATVTSQENDGYFSNDHAVGGYRDYNICPR